MPAFCPELLGVFAAGVEVPCKLVEVAAHLAALGRQGSKRRQCILAALRHHNGVLDIHAVQDAADEFGLQGASRWFCKFYCRNAVIVGLIAQRSSTFPFNQCISAF